MNELDRLNARAEFRALLDDFDGGHDLVQLEHFVVGQGITDYGRWRQACAEVSTRYAALKTIGFDRLKAEAQVAILDAEREQLEASPSPVDQARATLKRIEIAEQHSAIENLDRSAARLMRELEVVAALALKYRAACGGRDTPEAQGEYHVARLQRMAHARLVHGGADGVAETAMTLPEHLGAQVVEALHHFKEVAQTNAILHGQRADDQARALLAGKGAAQ